MLKRLLRGLFSSTATTTAAAEGTWAVGTAEDSGRPVIIRCRTVIPDEVQHSTYPNLIAISWQYASESGMPSPAEKEQMNVFEESISSLVEPLEQGILTVVVTGNQVCEWQFYAKDPQEFMRLLNEALSGKPQFPIQLSLQEDPEWAAYRKFKG